jgi:RNA polymerase sigma factor (TIGR02999 family)
MPNRSRDDLHRTLHAASSGDPRASEELLPLVYEELRAIAAARMRKLPPGNTLQPTALVHEAYLKLVGNDALGWNGRGHFFAAAAQAMRQILVDQVRRKRAVRHGGDRRRMSVDDVELVLDPPDLDLLALHDAVERLEADDPRKASIVMLRTFAGLDRKETACCLGISLRTVDREWRYIVARLHRELCDLESDIGH